MRRKTSVPPSARAPERLRVDVFVELSGGFGRGIYSGVVDYARETDGPEVRLWQARDMGHNRAGVVGTHGIIASVTWRKAADWLRTFRVPVVNVSARLALPPFVSVLVDNHAVGRSAAEHLLARGFTQFAFVGDSDSEASRERLRGFRETLARCQADIPALDLSRRQGAPAPTTGAGLRHWLGKQRHPLGVMATVDSTGVDVLRACAELGLRVPDQVAVVAGDNDAFVCELARPMLSSVEVHARTVGYRAMETLMALMRGDKPSRRISYVAPGEVVVRASSDTFGASDALVRRAIALLQGELSEPAPVARVAGLLDASSRVLEKRFRRSLRCSPHAVVTRLRIDQMKSLLTRTSLPVEEVGRRVGYAYRSHAVVAFKKSTGLTPSQYRAAHLPDAR